MSFGQKVTLAAKVGAINGLGEGFVTEYVAADGRFERISLGRLGVSVAKGIGFQIAGVVGAEYLRSLMESGAFEYTYDYKLVEGTTTDTSIFGTPATLEVPDVIVPIKLSYNHYVQNAIDFIQPSQGIGLGGGVLHFGIGVAPSIFNLVR